MFTMRVGNLVAGERVTLTLTLDSVLPVEDGAATFRFPLVVAPRYLPGVPLAGESVGDGYARDTDAVPDASRITPPVLLPGFPNPVRLTIDVGVDPGGLPLREVRSSLHAVTETGGRIRIAPGERADRDFILRLDYGDPAGSAAAVLAPDETGDEGTYQLTVVPPAVESARRRPRDLVLLLDRSGSMEGWKMVAARRAAARIVDTLTGVDRFAVLAFDTVVETPDGLPEGLVEATDRHRYRAVEHLGRMAARGGTELLDPLRRALALLAEEPPGGEGRDRVVVLVTDGQVGNEDQIVRASADDLRRVRVHTVGIDRAVNAGFLGRLASVGGGRCELVESEERLDEAMASIHQRIGSPLVTGVRLATSGLSPVEGTRTPQRLPDLFPGVPYVVRGRYRGAAAGSLTVSGTTPDGRAWSATATAVPAEAPALAAAWAGAALRDLEDRYAALRLPAHAPERRALAGRIVETSLRFGVLCRFTAYVAVDTRQVTEGGRPRPVVQPVEYPAGWQEPSAETGSPTPMPMAAVMSLGSAGTPLAGPARVLPSPARLSHPVARGGAGRGPTGDPADDPTGLRAQAAEETRRLRAAQGEPEYRRWELLEDLGTRLAALARDGAALARDGVRQLQALAARLVAGRGAGTPLAELWDEAVRVLEAIASQPAGSEPSRRRGPFWQR